MMNVRNWEIVEITRRMEKIACQHEDMQKQKEKILSGIEALICARRSVKHALVPC